MLNGLPEMKFSLFAFTRRRAIVLCTNIEEFFRRGLLHAKTRRYPTAMEHTYGHLGSTAESRRPRTVVIGNWGDYNPVGRPHALTRWV